MVWRSKAQTATTAVCLGLLACSDGVLRRLLLLYVYERRIIVSPTNGRMPIHLQHRSCSAEQ